MSEEQQRSLPKLRLSKLVRKSLSPTTFECQLDDGRLVKLSFKHGILKASIDNHQILEDYTTDEWNMSSYASEEDVAALLKRHDMIEPE